jgi:uncharacterized protein
MPANLVVRVETPGEHRDVAGVAPVWHTVAVLALVFCITGLTTRLPAGQRILKYIVIILAEWAIVAFIGFGVRLRGVSLRSLTGAMSPNLLQVLRDAGVAIIFLVASNLVLGILGRLAKAVPTEALRHLLPRGTTETTLYLLLALTAGICEEIIFRGYLQKQLTAWTSTAAAGVLLQGLIFGMGHAYQGPKFMAIIAVYGCLFGWLAQRLRSLRPGMIAHFLQDGVLGLMLARYALK